jgi:hypothetical protein
VAAIAEGLPAVITICMAAGAIVLPVISLDKWIKP